MKLTEWVKIAPLFLHVTSKLFQFTALGSVYMGPDPFGTGTKLVRISLVFTRAGPGGSGTDRICYLVPNESTY